MSNQEVPSVPSRVLLALQLCLGAWQIVKLTPLGGLLQGIMGWLLLILSSRLSPTYAKLQHLPGRVFKKVNCLVIGPEADETMNLSHLRDDRSVVKLFYLGADRPLKLRKEGNRLFINNKLSYFITESMWGCLQDIEVILLAMEKDGVFIKGYKEFWEGVASGGVMTLLEMLDCLILYNHSVKLSHNSWLLPVNLSVSEEKLLKFLNFFGVFLKPTKHRWLAPTLFSATSAILEFNTPLRRWLYGKFNLVVCSAMHFILNRLPYPWRKNMYSLGVWVENLKPSNDIELKVLKADRAAVIAGGAKICGICGEDDTAVPWEDRSQIEENEDNSFPCGPITIVCRFQRKYGVCVVFLSTTDNATPSFYVNCTSEEFRKIAAFLSCLAEHRSGSLKCYGPKKNVQVRGLKESVMCYAKCGFPPVFIWQLKEVNIK